MTPGPSGNDSSLREIFLRALEHSSPEEQRAYLDAVCGQDAARRSQVEVLLRHHCEDSFLESPAVEKGEGAGVGSIAAEAPGTVIDKYKLLEQLGQGGFGVVYMAEQKQPVKRRVAIKILKAGMDTREVVARFEAERQALALMDHPNIARVYDGGATHTGRPYFVMELVRGTRITDYCDEKHLSTRERLDLFIEICHAVQHAHQKGIIHRDLKPSNILVTVNDGKAVPKIIDFGIAKATQLELTEKTVFTRFHQFLGTPAYISPEQAELSSVDIDTRSDIYSLGVLLYELLTGKTPFDGKELLQAGLDEMRRTIREKEPARPSTLVSTLGGEELTTTARRRGLEPPKLISTLCGDLDWIAMKCLEKDRSRRYETANGLARDIQRHLSSEPVTACPPGNFYRLQKFVRRNRLAVSAAVAVVAFVLLGLSGVTWALLAERRARRVERVRLQKAEVLAKIYKAKRLYESSQREEAEKLLDEIPAEALEPDSEHARMRRRLTWWYAIHEKWDKAATNCAVLARVNGLEHPEDIARDRLEQSIILVQKGDIGGYETFRENLLASSVPGGSGNAVEICRVYLLLPTGQPIPKKIDDFYKKVAHARTLDETSDWKGWLSLTLALIDYRRGDYSQAISNAQACVEGPYHAYVYSVRVPSAQAVLAMAYHQLHKDKEASEALASARENDYRYLSPVASDDFPWALFDGLYGDILLREAEALIEGHLRQDKGYYATGELCLAKNYWHDGSSDAEAAKWFRIAIKHGSYQAGLNFAVFLATCRDPKIHDGTNALRLVEEIVAREGRGDTVVLDALATAYAANRQFDKAVETEKEALAGNRNPEEEETFQAHLKLYESGKELRD